MNVVKRRVNIEVDNGFCLSYVYIFFDHIKRSMSENLLQSVDITAVFKVCRCKSVPQKGRMNPPKQEVTVDFCCLERLKKTVDDGVCYRFKRPCQKQFIVIYV